MEDRQNVLLFIIMSGELDALMAQLNYSIEGMKKTYKKNIPDKADELDRQLPEEFWDGHKSNIKRALYEETAERFTDEQLQKLLDFFKSEEGRAYLEWKSHITSRPSKYYQANVEMHRQANNIYNRIKDQG